MPWHKTGAASLINQPTGRLWLFSVLWLLGQTADIYLIIKGSGFWLNRLDL